MPDLIAMEASSSLFMPCCYECGKEQDNSDYKLKFVCDCNQAVIWKEEEISPKLAPVVYVMLYVRSLNHLPPEMFACLDRPETI